MVAMFQSLTQKLLDLWHVRLCRNMTEQKLWQEKRGYGYDAIRKKQFWSNSVSLIINHMVENWQKDASSVESVGTSFPFLISHYIHVQKTAASC